MKAKAKPETATIKYKAMSHDKISNKNDGKKKLKGRKRGMKGGECNIYMSTNDSKSTHIIVRIIAYSLEMPSVQTGLWDSSSKQQKKTNKIIKKIKKLKTNR